MPTDSEPLWEDRLERDGLREGTGKELIHNLVGPTATVLLNEIPLDKNRSTPLDCFALFLSAFSQDL